MYDTDDELSDSKDDNDIIPNPSSLLNLKRCLAFSHDEQEIVEDHDAMDSSEEMTVISFHSTFSAQIDLLAANQDDKENGSQPTLHWGELVSSQQNLGSLLVQDSRA